ncbi:MAG: redoxin domain-containing protein [Deltaproteobacteria bacterium]|nr:redoxin domain-containing protein [Deltaproteobacteria bacterium]
MKPSIQPRLRTGVVLLLLGLAAVLGYGACGWWTIEPRTTPIQVKRPAPEFALPDHEGTVVRLSDLLARGPVVVIFYRGHW